MKFIVLLPALFQLERLYDFFQLVNHFKQDGHIIDIYTFSNVSAQLSGFPKINQINNFNSEIPLIDTYDILFLGHPSKSMLGNVRKIINYFIKYRKKVIYLKIFPTIEYMNLGNQIHYGTPSQFYTKYSITSKSMPPANLKYNFRCPFFGIFNLNNPTILSRPDFCKLYNLDQSKKIVALFPGKIRKIVKYLHKYKDNNSVETLKRYHLFVKYFKNIWNIFNKHNYQWIYKSHKGDKNFDDKLFTNIYKTLIKVEDRHSAESIKYADKTITFATSLSYELYLYNRPTLDFGTGLYFLRWGAGELDRYELNRDYKKLYGTSLVYGRVVKMNEWSNLESVIEDFIKQKYNIKNYPYLKNHPIFGDTYSLSVEDVYQILKKQFLPNVHK